jgi:hypothetical protein
MGQLPDDSGKFFAVQTLVNSFQCFASAEHTFEVPENSCSVTSNRCQLVHTKTTGCQSVAMDPEWPVKYSGQPPMLLTY